LPWKQKKGDLNFFGFLSSNFMKLCRNIHCSAFEGLKKFKMAAVAMVTKVQKNVKFTPNSGSF
jgi:hypothetical protein